MSMIVKIQRPLMTSHENPDSQWYFYNETRSYKEIRAPSIKERKVMGNNLKIYAEYNNKMKIVKQVEDQIW